MKGYSKIKLMNNDKKTRSMSMDFSDQTIITPRFQKLISNKKPTTTITQQQQSTIPQSHDDDDDYSHYSSNNPQEQQVDTFPNDQILTKNQSVATNSTPNDANAKSSRFKIEKQNSTGRTLHTSVLRALSMRRSSSVSERYARIHDHYSNTFDIEDCHEEQQEEMQETRSKDMTKKQNKRSAILKVCKRIFGL
ncbi:hypothetical protein Tco_0847485 [Tanacetum coccineum]